MNRPKNTYVSEKDRLMTFSKWHNIPVPGNLSFNVSPFELAENGFIHVGPEDDVICVFCNLHLDKWRKEFRNKVHERHREHNSNCDFVNGLSHKVNIPFRDPQVTIEMTTAAKIPAFASKILRRESFECWPYEHPDRILLVDAGFFYKPHPEIIDKVQCFMCGTTVYKWEDGDVPLTEHKKINPNCEFVKKLSGVLGTSMGQNSGERHAGYGNASVVTENDTLYTSTDNYLENHIAVLTVLQEYGHKYTKESVLRAFRQLEISRVRDSEVTARDLLESLDNE